MPERIQLRRTKGWRKPEGAVVVARPSRWGNPHVVTKQAGTRYSDGLVCPPWWKIITDVERQYHMVRLTEAEARQLAVDEYRRDLERQRGFDLSALRGCDLACWCPLDQPCHADVLLELANAETTDCGACGARNVDPSEPCRATDHYGRTYRQENQ